MNRSPGYPMPRTGKFEWPDVGLMKSLQGYELGPETFDGDLNKLPPEFISRFQIERDGEMRCKREHMPFNDLSPIAHDLACLGFSTQRLPDHMDKLKKCFQPYVDELLEKKPVRSFREYDRSVHFTEGRPIHLVQEAIQSVGGIVAAQQYFGFRRMHVERVVLHISMPDDVHYKQVMSDVEEVTKTINFHFDPKAGTIKGILYLKEIGVDNGPFTVWPASHRQETKDLHRCTAGNISRLPQ